MTTFDLHIMRRLATGFLLLVLGLIVFFIVLHYVEFVDDFFDRGATMRDVFLGYYPSYVPEIVYLIAPLALFLAAIYLTGKLAQSLQFVALQTSGVSLYRLLVPYLVVGLALTVFFFWFNGWVVPTASQERIAFEMRYMKDAPRQETTEIHRQNAPGSIVSVGLYDRDMNVAHNVSLQRFEGSERLTERIDAVRMSWIDSLSTWRLEAPVVRTFDGGREEIRRPSRMDTTLNLFPRDFARTEQDVVAMTIPAAQEYVATLRRSGASNLGEPLVGYYGKFAYPFANLILLLIAVPMASVRRRGGQAVQFGLGLLVAFLYLAVQKLAEPFGYAGTLPPALTAWLPHAAFALVAIAILVRARK